MFSLSFTLSSYVEISIYTVVRRSHLSNSVNPKQIEQKLLKLWVRRIDGKKKKKKQKIETITRGPACVHSVHVCDCVCVKYPVKNMRIRWKDIDLKQWVAIYPGQFARRPNFNLHVPVIHFSYN